MFVLSFVSVFCRPGAVPCLNVFVFRLLFSRAAMIHLLHDTRVTIGYVSPYYFIGIFHEFMHMKNRRLLQLLPEFHKGFVQHALLFFK